LEAQTDCPCSEKDVDEVGGLNGAFERFRKFLHRKEFETSPKLKDLFNISSPVPNQREGRAVLLLY
jgi:hypothetical protein